MDSLSPNWRDRRNENQKFAHVFLSPDYSRKKLKETQRSRKAEVLQQNKDSISNKKQKITTEFDDLKLSTSSTEEKSSPTILEHSKDFPNHNDISIISSSFSSPEQHSASADLLPMDSITETYQQP